MERKPNLSSVNYYAEKYATEVCNDFFRQRENINGKQLLEITPTKQINLFVVKSIFEKWQLEVSRIKSPYFNYQAPEIKETLNLLMNQLSKNIQIEVNDFKPLLRQAVIETIFVLFSPTEYVQLILNQYQNKRISIETDLKPIFKYIKIHTKVFDKMSNALADEGKFLQKKRASAIVDEVMSKNQELLDKPYNLIHELNDIVPIGIFELVPDWEDKNLKVQEEDDYFSLANQSDLGLEILYEDKINNEELREKESKENASWMERPAMVAVSKNIEFKKESEKEASESQNSTTTEKVILGNYSKEETEEEDTNIPLLQRISILQSQNTSQSAEKPATLLERLSSQHAKRSLKSAFPLNLKIKFQNELFGGDHHIFQNCLEELEKCEDYHSALDLLRQKYWSLFNWNDENESTIQFLGIIDDHF
jgi:hypothetical protein